MKRKGNRNLQVSTYLDGVELDRFNQFLKKKGLNKASFLRVCILEAMEKNMEIAA